MAVLLGPILQFRGVVQQVHRVSALVVVELGDAVPVLVGASPGVKVSPAHRLAEIPFLNPSKTAWRFDLEAPLGAGSVSFSVAGVQSSYQVLAPGETPRLAYGSCNGFSDPKQMKQVARKNDRWEHLAQMHARRPYHLLLLGGDQVYSDDMWKSIAELEQWTNLDRPTRSKAKFTQAMQKRLDSFFCELYLKRWAQVEMQAVFQCIPTIMMWDDHDIMDGWGSYPLDLHASPVYQGIFQTARRYFQLFQAQCAEGERHPCAIPNQTAFSLGFTQLGDVALLVPDLRSERRPADAQTPDQIIGPDSWNAIYAWLEGTPPGYKHLLLMSSIPVAYLDLGKIERLLSILPGQQELEDDLRDHWRSVAHVQERLRLIHRLFLHAVAQSCRVTIISGDVHVGAVSVLESTRSEHQRAGESVSVINQLVSTGMVHPAPPALVRYVLESVSSAPESVDRGITATMQSLTGNGRYLIGARNWLALEPDDAHRLWANWHLEGADHPLTKVIHG